MTDLEPQMKRFAQKRCNVANWNIANPKNITLKETVKNSKATVLIGVTAQTGLFDSEILANMAENTERPIILALSNPTSKSECTPTDVMKATKGKGIMAAGSPFAPVEGPEGLIYTSQCNNMYIFPGMGLGALISKTQKITHKMFLAASAALSEIVTEEQRAQGLLLPGFQDIRNVSFHIALAVAKEARDSGLGRLLSDEEYAKIIRKAQWKPEYYKYRPANPASISKKLY